MSRDRAVSSTRATSLSRTTGRVVTSTPASGGAATSPAVNAAPPAAAAPPAPWSPTLTMICLNCSTSSSRPRVLRVYWNACPGRAGSCPSWPAATCTFCSRIASTTSGTVRLFAASRSGSSQARIE